MKNRWLLFFSFLLVQMSSIAQIFEPVKWDFSQEQKEDSIYFYFTANIDDTWHIYSQHIDGFGPIPTTFVFEKSEGLVLSKSTKQPKATVKFDKSFNLDVGVFDTKVTFVHAAKVNTSNDGIVSGYVEFMVCNDERCLPPAEEYFLFNFKGVQQKVVPKEESKEKLAVQSNKVEQKAKVEGEIKAPIKDKKIVTQSSFHTSIEKNVTIESSVVNWALNAEIDTVSKQIRLTVNGEIENGWHVYATEQTNEFVVPFQINEEVPVKVLNVKGNAFISEETELFGKVNFYEKQIAYTFDLSYENQLPKELVLTFMACDEEKCLPPDELIFPLVEVKENMSTVQENKEWTSLIPNLSIDLSNPVKKCGELLDIQGKGYLTIFLLGFFGGLLALLTPCVFPMIPLTVSFFTKAGKNRKDGIKKSLIYGAFIFLIYFSISLPFHFFNLDPEVFNNISTSVPLNIFFFVVFVFFALSFFGLFELQLPNSWANKMDTKSDIGGFIGIFFMAVTLVIVSFSCTGPILGSLLAGAFSPTAGDPAWQLTAGMSGFGVSLALPFALFAIFPSLLSSLPSSGRWLSIVKVNLGFIELALALKFLSQADAVVQWHLIHRETFFLIWILIGIAMVFFNFGVFGIHGSHKGKISLGRKLFGSFVLGAVIYLIPGVFKTGAWKHELLSGFPPPQFYSWYNQDGHCPLGLNCFHDLEQGLAYAKEQNKPVFLDFTGWACVNCRNMEENVWSEPQNYQLLNDKYVVISLYVDDKTPLPEELKGEVILKSSGKKKRIKTVGDRWATFQTENFNINSQPFYVLMDADARLLTHTFEKSDSEEFNSMLNCGLDAYQE